MVLRLECRRFPMVPDRKARKKPYLVRRVVSRLEEVVCEAPALGGLYGARAQAPGDVARMLAPVLSHEPVEVFVALLLSGKHRVTGYAEVSRGTLTSSLVHPREVFGPALRESAAAVIVAHNHPSGDPEPSAEDLAVTERLRDAGRLLGVPLLDHLILGADEAFVSMRGRLEF